MPGVPAASSSSVNSLAGAVPTRSVLLTDASTDRDRLDRLLGTMAVRPQVLDASGNLAAQSRAAFVALLRAAR